VRIIIACAKRILHLKARYIYVACPFIKLQTSCSQARTIHFRQLHPLTPDAFSRRTVALTIRYAVFANPSFSSPRRA